MEVPTDDHSPSLTPEDPGTGRRGWLILAVGVSAGVIAAIAISMVLPSAPPPPSTTSSLPPSTTTPPPPTAAELTPLWRAAEHLEEAYTDLDTFDRRELVEAAISGLAEAADLNEGEASDDLVPDDVPPGFERVWRMWSQIEGGETPSRDLMVRAIREMVATTGDPGATVLVDVAVEPDGYVENAYHGIGAFVNTVDDLVVISQPFPGSPAARAGIRPGDVVVGVDGESVAGMSIDEVVALVRGPAGTTVRLLLVRAGSDPVEVDVVREAFELGTARSSVHPEGIGYLKVSSFEARTPGEVENQVEGLLTRDIRALIVDLRGNPGGRPAAALAVADQFLDGELVYFEEELDGTRTAHHAEAGGLVTELPLAVLTDGGTVGASEMVAAALRHHQRGPLIGLPTAGQATLYEGRELGEGVVVVVRSGTWSTPDRVSVGPEGLEPDFVVGLTEEDFASGFDRPQQAANAYLWSLVEGLLEEADDPEREVEPGG